MGKRLIILITGTTSGFGKVMAESLADCGHTVIGTSRNKNINNNFEILKMDMCSNDDINEGVDSIIKKYGCIDVLINNAGVPCIGPLEETNLKDIQRVFNTNLLGPIYLMKKVIPIMRLAGSGKIINISSVGGSLGIPYNSLYSSSKFAMEGVSESLSYELKKFNISITIVAPSFFKTGILAGIKGQAKTMYYEPEFTKFYSNYNGLVSRGGNPKKIAKLILKIINSKNPSLKYPLGLAAKFETVSKRFLPFFLVSFFTRIKLKLN